MVPHVCQEISGEILEISWKFHGNFIWIRGTDLITKIDIVKQQIKNFTIGLQENNPEIIPDPLVKYLRK